MYASWWLSTFITFSWLCNSVISIIVQLKLIKIYVVYRWISISKRIVWYRTVDREKSVSIMRAISWTQNFTTVAWKMQEIHCYCKTLDLMTVSEEMANMTWKIKVDEYSHKSLQWLSAKNMLLKTSERVIQMWINEIFTIFK